ncbi:MAG: TldD/PmbA family protein, partial [Candidatus Thorarchaeota archaeon]|nr:TldD/PmbA family protein [Candidatus Thorarchaeota archaeon]
MFKHLEEIIATGTSLGASYAEARGEKSFVEYIQMDDGRVNALTRRIEQGIALRVLVDGAWGFLTTSQLDGLDDAVEDAISMARAAARTRREPIELAEVDTYEDSVEADIERDPQYVPIEEKIKYLKDLTAAAKDYDERISAVTGKLRSISGNTFLCTSEGSRIKKPKLLVWVYPWISGKEGTQLTAARYEEASTHEGWEFMENTATPEMVAEEAAKRVVLQLDGVKSKAGSFPCVLGPRVIGVLAHEALGHLAEADLTVKSAFADKAGEIVAAEGVNMIDDGTDAK